MRHAFWIAAAILALITSAGAAEPADAPDASTKPAEDAAGTAADVPVTTDDLKNAGSLDKAGDLSSIDEAIDDYAADARMEETVVTVTRTPLLTFESYRSATVVSKDAVKEMSPIQPIAAITQRDASIVMDIRTSTTGDPVIRGFAGFNLLALIDGNSLSTLWGEGGFGADDMYGKVDPHTVERMEVVNGPGSVMYGSNALGGVVHFITRSSPIDYTDEGFDWGGAFRLTYMSNPNGLNSRLETFGATPEFKYLVGVTHGNYNDSESGRGGQTLDPTSGRETNFDIRTDWLFAPGNELSVSILNVYRSHMHRFYRPTQDNKNERLGVAVTWKAEELFEFMVPFEWRVYYQDKRDQRRFLDTGKNGYAQTLTYSTDLQASSDVGSGHLLTYGLHGSLDDGESPDDEQFTFTKPAPERADAPNSEWWNFAAFILDEWEAADWLTLTGSLRYDYFVFESLETGSYQPAAGDREDDFFEDETSALTGGIGATVKLDEDWRLLASWSRGFRQYAPNFGFRQIGVGVLVPNELLDPVTSDNFELGLRTRNPWLAAEGFVYYSDIESWQAIRPDTYNGSDWYDFNENGERDANETVVSQQSEESAYVWGIEASATIFLKPLFGQEFPDGFSVWSSFAWNRGKVSDGEYLRHTQPTRCLLGLRWDDSDPKRQAYFEFITDMTDRYHRIPTGRKQNDLAYRRDPQDGDSPLLRSYGGVPGYTIFSVYAGMNLCESARLNVAVENLTDKKYRRAHSRMDAFGINFVTSIELTF